MSYKVQRLDNTTGLIEEVEVPSVSDVPVNLSSLTEDADHRTVTDTEKSTWNSKVDPTDSRLSDSRPASDVYAWAKAETKPSYTTAEISDSADKRYCTDAQKTVIGNTSNTNTGDETASTIKTKLGITTLSGSNTGDETTSTIKTKLGITTLSGSNTGDETTSTIKTKLGITTLSGSNTGDETSSTIKTKLGPSGGSTDGYLSSTDWNTFNNKLTSSLTSARLFVGNASNVATARSITGDMSISNTGVVTIGTVAPSVSTVCKRDANGGSQFYNIISKMLSVATQSAELITNPSDRDFSSLVNWSGSGWTLGANQYEYNVAGSGGAATLSAYAPTANNVYLVVMTIECTSPGAISILYGSDGIYLPMVSEKYVYLPITAASTDYLQIVPDANWTGSIRDISIVELISSTPNQTMLGQFSAKGSDIRAWSSAIGIGEGALAYSQQPYYLDAIAIGKDALKACSSNSNVAVGYWSLRRLYTGSSNVAIGNNTLEATTDAAACIAIGAYAMQGSVSPGECTAIGIAAGYSDSGFANISIGSNAALNQTTGGCNIAMGSYSLGGSLGSQQPLNENTCVGYSAAQYLRDGTGNASLGTNSLINIDTGNYNTAIGYSALASSTNISNSSGIGANSEVTGDNQIQLGDSSTTTYAYGAVQNRSDLRDKTDIVDTDLGLEFISKLRPVKFRWDMREDYRPEKPSAPKITRPILRNEATEEEKTEYYIRLSEYNSEMAKYKTDLDKWTEQCNISNITHDGTKKRNRFHQGLIAQEVKAVMDELGVDFAGYQDHLCKGGEDVKSIGYTELIAPLIKAVQELSARVKYLESKIITN